jgi:hypothetical protein
MKIVQVEYSKLVSNTGSFGNQKIGAVAEVEADEMPGEALGKLMSWVNLKLKTPPKQLTNDERREIALDYIHQRLNGEIPF